jgi:hypothetical protein
MENEIIMAPEPCCGAITTCGTPTPIPNTCPCDEPLTAVIDEVHEEYIKFVAVLQESVLHSWKLHLKAKKYSVHVFLEEYYNEALDIIDGLIEHYQGICKCDIIRDNVDMMFVKNDDPLTYFTDLKDYILNFTNNPNNFNERTSEIKSDIDDLLRLIDSTLYKLGNLTESNIKSFNEFVYEKHHL